MEYRKLPHGEENISILGLGTSSIGMAGEKEAEAVMTMALEAGINFFDMASADAAPFPAYGRAINGVRNKLYFQIHFGANYQTGKYGWIYVWNFPDALDLEQVEGVYVGGAYYPVK